jgi:hypothetical protein
MGGVTILDAMRDSQLFGRQFGDGSWRAWRAFLAALFGLPLQDDEARATFRAHTGRESPPEQPCAEAWLVVGRRGGKSRIAALVAVFLACFRDYSDVLAAGEVGTVMVLAADRKQARTVFRYITGLLDGVPMLARMVVNRTRETLELDNRVVIEVHTASYRSVRGYSIVAAVCDEIAFWDDPDSANPDVEVVNALRPGMATVPGAMLLAISTPYARGGALWAAYDAHYGRDGDPVLVWRADTASMNPTVPRSLIDQAYERDPAAAAAEYGAEFRRDVETFLTDEVLEAVTVAARYELPPVEGVRYSGFVDPSGGSGDSFTLAIAHGQDGLAVLDCVRETRPPFSPEAVTKEYAALLKSYRLSEVTGDRYGGQWPQEQFRKQGVFYRVAGQTKSELYLELLPALNSGRVELLDHRGLTAQLLKLERRTSRTGKDSVDHPPRGHDDVANSAAGALCAVLSAGPGVVIYTATSLGLVDDAELESERLMRRWKLNLISED